MTDERELDVEPDEVDDDEVDDRVERATWLALACVFGRAPL